MGERFTAGFDLPNDTCYCETCASIGLALFALRMSRLERDASYADVMERALYNTVLAGVNREGNRFFYVNPLEIIPDFCDRSTSLGHVKAERQEWIRRRLLPDQYRAHARFAGAICAVARARRGFCQPLFAL